MSDSKPIVISKRTVRFSAIAVAVIALLISGTSIFITTNRTNGAHAKFEAAQASMVKEVEADDNAHAALTTAQNSDFASNAVTTTSDLTTCLGSSATSSTTAGLTQLSGFNTATGAARAVLPVVHPSNSEASYNTATVALKAALATGRFETKETKADITAMTIVENEVTSDLYSIATSIGGKAHTVTAKYVYATKPVVASYNDGVSDVTSQVTTLAPVLGPGAKAQPSETDRMDLVGSLEHYATECKAVAKSSAANKPVPTHVRVPFRVPALHFITICVPGVMQFGIWVQYGYCYLKKT